MSVQNECSRAFMVRAWEEIEEARGWEEVVPWLHLAFREDAWFRADRGRARARALVGRAYLEEHRIEPDPVEAMGLLHAAIACGVRDYDGAVAAREREIARRRAGD